MNKLGFKHLSGVDQFDLTLNISILKNRGALCHFVFDLLKSSIQEQSVVAHTVQHKELLNLPVNFICNKNVLSQHPHVPMNASKMGTSWWGADFPETKEGWMQNYWDILDRKRKWNKGEILSISSCRSQGIHQFVSGKENKVVRMHILKICGKN